MVGHLDDDRGFPDPGSPADQDERSRNDPAAEHAIELFNTGERASVVLRFDLRKSHGRGLSEPRRESSTGLGRSLHGGAESLLHHRVPFFAIRTLPGPLARLAAAV